MQRQLNERVALADRVTRVIARTQKLPVEAVTINKTFEELNIDSLDGINILFALEGEFDIDIPDDAARSIKSIREMVDGVEALLDAKTAKQVAAAGSEAAPPETPDKPA
ncbi:MAG: phosphopantetheine-binding protein [Acidobacteriota bacterium]